MEPWMIASITVVSLLILLMTGLPVAFALTGLSALLLYLFLGPSALFIVVGSAFKQIGTEVFIAIPLFVLMAAVLQFSGIASSLYRTMHMWMGPLRGGLAIGTIFICTIIDALSGIGATATTTMGLIALPEMLKRGYNRHMAVGVITVGGALGPLIPPSILMIIVGGYAQLSVGKLFLGGVLPGLLIAFGYALYMGIRCAIRPQDGPSIDRSEQGTLKDKVANLRYVILPLGLIFFIMGGIYTGIFTPTEAAGFGALGAVVIAVAYGKFTFSNMLSALQLSMKVTCMIMWLVVGGGCYSALVTVTGTGNLVLDVLSSLPFGAMGVIVVMLGIALVMGMFIDPVAISMICIPIFLPVVNVLGIDLLWFMLLFVIAVVIGYITPPFGLNIFYMKGVAPDEITIMDIYKGVMPFTAVKMACLGLCILFPGILTYLPGLVK
ncbi:MAG: TRAP transporter large permease subunit [Desulfobacteraceae bacterium]|nr:MAG: TRAP transporter large permease subunit [Desulfobacteraceae bacterium]